MNKTVLRTVLAAALIQVGSATAGDICDQIREAAERTATSKTEEMRIYREYQECKRNLQKQQS